MRTSFAAISFLAGLVAANGGYGDYEPSTVVLTSTDVQTITSCAGGCVHTSVSAPPVHTPSPPVHTPEVPPTSLVHPTPVVPETCVPTTVTVTVTIPAGPSGTPPVAPPVSPPVVPSQPPHSSVSPPKPTTVLPPVVPSVPSTPTPTPSPPVFTGAASHANAGAFVAGAGIFAALFL